MTRLVCNRYKESDDQINGTVKSLSQGNGAYYDWDKWELGRKNLSLFIYLRLSWRKNAQIPGGLSHPCGL